MYLEINGQQIEIDTLNTGHIDAVSELLECLGNHYERINMSTNGRADMKALIEALREAAYRLDKERTRMMCGGV